MMGVGINIYIYIVFVGVWMEIFRLGNVLGDYGLLPGFRGSRGYG